MIQMSEIVNGDYTNKNIFFLESHWISYTQTNVNTTCIIYYGIQRILLKYPLTVDQDARVGFGSDSRKSVRFIFRFCSIL